jgi:hypothetical protein
MKMGPDALCTVENVSGRAKSWKRDPTRNMKTGPGAQNMKMGPDALHTAENVSGRAK